MFYKQIFWVVERGNPKRDDLSETAYYCKYFLDGFPEVLCFSRFYVVKYSVFIESSIVHSGDEKQLKSTNQKVIKGA